MIIVHDTFICKPGNASKVAKMFKDMMSSGGKQVAIMTDLTGQFHRVIMASWHDSLSAYEKSMEMMMKDDSKEAKEMNEKMAGMRDMYLTGSREIYRVW